ncbi:MAG: T9SS type A sorting domain-containing protein [candidate division Zixibacteria bacterium]|nr:T9SS type A sorting domain-containing protein [candidate division Zixibacteria bacterium]
MFYNPWGCPENHEVLWGEDWYQEGEQQSNLPSSIEVKPNYPNPFNASTSIAFNLPEPSRVNLRIYNLAGQLVDDVIDARMTAGEHNINWNGSTYPSGIYYYSLEVNETIFNGKMTLLK